MKWWEEVGKFKFKRIYVCACVILMVPDSNGHQERTFSTGTWMDTVLQRMQSAATFEMKVLLYRNREFMKMAEGHVSEVG